MSQRPSQIVPPKVSPDVEDKVSSIVDRLYSKPNKDIGTDLSSPESNSNRIDKKYSKTVINSFRNEAKEWTL